MRLAADAAHGFGGIALNRARPLAFRLDGRRIAGFAGDTVLSAVLAAGTTGSGTLARAPVALSPSFAPLVRTERGSVLPMDRTPALDGLVLTTIGAAPRFRLRQPHSLGRLLEALPDPPWLRAEPEATRTADLLVVGGGVAGLSAAEAASAAGLRVVVAERRPWFGGDARYFGPVGDQESPEAAIARLVAALETRDKVTLLLSTEVFAVADGSARLHRVEVEGNVPRARVERVEAARILLATGTAQRLPVFAGNRMPGVISAIDAYHLAKRYGVALGSSAVVATQSNHAYRLAMRLNDAGVAVRRVSDTRIHPQSRFVDFAKASGLTLASGQIPTRAQRGRFSFAPLSGSGASVEHDADQLVVSGNWQPELTLWMLAGGNVRWAPDKHALLAHGDVEHLALAGSAAGHRSMAACLASGRAAYALLFGQNPPDIEDSEPGTALETPEAPTPVAPAAGGVLPAFLDSGRTLVPRPPEGPAAAETPRALSLGDVAALVELGQIVPGDAGAIAEERGAPGADLVASAWTPDAAAPGDGTALPAYLVKRFGDDPHHLHLVVDGRRTFSTGALIYSATGERQPEYAIGVILAPAEPGGLALIVKSARKLDRFIVETGAGPSPARPKR